MRRKAESPFSLVRITGGMRVAGSGDMVIARGFQKIVEDGVIWIVDGELSLRGHGNVNSATLQAKARANR